LKFLSPLLSILLTPLLATGPMMAQAPGSASDNIPASLQVRVVDSDGPNALTGSRSVKGFTAEVMDASGARVENAAVVFRLPDSAPSGKFADGGVTAVAYTDAQGRAGIGGIQWGDAPGAVEVRITAAKGMMHAGVLLEENLTGRSSPPTGSSPQISRPAGPAPVPAQATNLSMPVMANASTVAAAPSVVVASLGAHRRPVEPGTLAAQPAMEASAVADDNSPDANVPIRHFAETGAGLLEAPGVSIVSSGAASGGGHSKTKWLIVLAVAAGAGAAIALAHKGGSTSSSSGITIGSPSVSVGHP
jgi:hypothetical protein